MQNKPNPSDKSPKPDNKRKFQVESLRNFCEAVRLAGFVTKYSTALFNDKASRTHTLNSRDTLSHFTYVTLPTDRPELATIVQCGIFLVFYSEETELVELAREVLKHWPAEEFSRHPREIKPTVYGTLMNDLLIQDDRDNAMEKNKAYYENNKMAALPNPTDFRGRLSTPN